MSSVYILKPDGSIQTEITDNNQQLFTEFKVSNKDTNGVSIPLVKGDSMSIDHDKSFLVAAETLGSFKSGKNFAEITPSLFDGTSLDFNNNEKNVIGQSSQLYSYAHGNNMILKTDEDNNQTVIGPSPLPFYLSYNSFFDLDQRLTQKDIQVEGVQIFADSLDFFGVPQVLIDPSKAASDISNVTLTLVDFFIASVIPIASMSILQGILQSAQSGPVDPFGILPQPDLQSQDYDYGRYIKYFKFNEMKNPTLSAILNPVIEGIISLLNTMEKLMSFPKFPLGKGNLALQITQNILRNTVNFVLGYILYLIPGFKLGQNINQNSDSLDIIANLIFTVITSLTTSNKSKHNYNLLVRKIIRNQFFMEKLKSSRITTDLNGNEYTYIGQSLIKFSSFFYKFIGQRVAVGNAALQILNQSINNRGNNLFSVSKMNELPEQIPDDENGLTPPVIGPSIFDKKSNTEDSQKDRFFNRSIYSLTSLVTNEGYANSYLKYHDKLSQQTNKIVNEYAIRLDQKHVEEIENIIDSDYMPFSIQDLRTNEVFKFHAFVESYTDTFSPEWEDAGKGFGRMDPIKIYKGTTRNISVDFHLIAMNPEDFDNMWYMINRLIALIYPQWSKPIEASTLNQEFAGIQDSSNKNIPIKFGQPFTQIPINSPIIRLKLGDLFTSNYSKKNLARIFGFEENMKENYNLTANADNIKNVIKSDKNKIKNETYAYEGSLIIEKDKFNQYLQGKDKNSYIFGLHQEDFSKDNNFKINYNKNDNILTADNILKLYRNYSNFWWSESASINLNDINNPGTEGKFPNSDQIKAKKLFYIPVNITDIQTKLNKIAILLFSVTDFSSFFQQNEKKIANNLYGIVFNSFINQQNDNGINDLNKKRAVLDGFMKASGEWKYNDVTSLLEEVSDASNKVNNPVVKSFESNLGEGLAGTIQNFSISYDQSIPWQLDKGSRAPMSAKINLSMSVIHDILPGLDHNGVMRAPTYRIGNINRRMFGGSVRDEIPSDFVYKE